MTDLRMAGLGDPGSCGQPRTPTAYARDVTSIFTRIIEGDIGGRFVWSDEICVAFMDVRPLNRGHVLVVPRAEVDHWIDLSEQTMSHLIQVAQRVARAQQEVLAPGRVGLMIAGFEIAHAHIHVVPCDGMQHLDFGQADSNPDPADLDGLAARLQDQLGYSPA